MTRAVVLLLAAAFSLGVRSFALDDGPSHSKSRPPVAIATADPHEGLAPLRVCFDASKSYHPERKTFVFRWDFGDGRGTASEPKACHEYIQPGLYAAMLTVTDDRGMEDSRVLIIAVREVP